MNPLIVASSSPACASKKAPAAELERRGVEIVRFDDREFWLDLGAPNPAMLRCDVVLERCINHLRALYTLRVLNDWDVPTVNSYEVGRRLRRQASHLDRIGACRHSRRGR